MKRFGLIGRSLDHSFSPPYFEKKFRKLRLDDHSYEAFPLESIGALPALLESTQLDGFNVTIPYKEEVIPFLDSLSEEAKAVGAVNCVHREGGALVGYNTDVFGFDQALTQLLDGATIQWALILGSGGASKAVRHALEQRGIQTTIVSRSGDTNYENLTSAEVRRADLIVNTTPLGMHPDTDVYPDIPYEAIASKHYVMDLIYNPEQTNFLRKANILGAKTMNGMRMLELQAEKSWDIWNT